MISRRMTDNTGTAINNMGHDCVIIDYVNPARSAAYDMKSQIKQLLKKMIRRPPIFFAKRRG